MAPVTRRQSMRLAEKAVEADAENQNRIERATKQDSISSVSSISTVAGGTGRVTKSAEQKGRVIASRYMSSLNSKKPEMRGNRTPTSTAAIAARATTQRARIETSTLARRTSTRSVVNIGMQQPKRPESRQQAAASARRYMAMVAETEPQGSQERANIQQASSTDLYSTYVQWLMIEARSQMAFNEAKEAAAVDLEHLAYEAECAKQALADEQRKFKLMRELDALSRWMTSNRGFLVDMKTQIARVRSSYSKFSESLDCTTRAMPISNVHFSDAESLVRDLQGFVDSVASSFSKDSKAIQQIMQLTSKLNQYYKVLRQEQELLSECSRLKESLSHTAALAVSGSIGNKHKHAL
ncbi:hypothetical protein BX070DRAFT_254831 [Coemansia spiralis]|nr:hypothetical protein BX070DRAFT_254831 [Coemansia spiralis]